MRQVVAGVVIAVVAAGGFAGTAVAQKAPSDATCDAFLEYSRIASLDRELEVLLAPRSHALAARLSRSGPPPLREHLRAVARHQGTRVAVLEDEGLTPRQLRSLGRDQLTPGSQPEEHFVGLGIEERYFDFLEGPSGEVFSRTESGPKLRPTSKAGRAFDRLSAACGVSPRTVDCEELLTSDEVAAVIGPVVKTDDEGCGWYAAVDPNPAAGPEHRVFLSVYENPNSYPWHAGAAGSAAAVPGLGDEAVLRQSTFLEDQLPYRAAVVRAGDQVVEVELELGLEPVPDEQLVGLAQLVVDRL